MTTFHHLLVVHHSQSGSTERLTQAILAGADAEEISGVVVRGRRAFDATADDVRWCHALILATPENFGYMSGALKDFFDRVYYDLNDETRGRPYVLVVKGQHDDGSGATLSVQRIVAGLGWKEIQPPLIVLGEVTEDHLARAHELGMTVAAGLELGVY